MKRKLLAGFMAVCLILTLLPATALADDETTSPFTVGEKTFDSLQTAAAAANDGDTITIDGGNFNIGTTTINKAVNIKGAGAGKTVLIGNLKIAGSSVDDKNTDSKSITVSGITLEAADAASNNWGLYFGNGYANSTTWLNGWNIAVTDCAFEGWQFAVCLQGGKVNGATMSDNTLTVTESTFTDVFCATSVDNAIGALDAENSDFQAAGEYLYVNQTYGGGDNGTDNLYYTTVADVYNSKPAVSITVSQQGDFAGKTGFDIVVLDENGTPKSYAGTIEAALDKAVDGETLYLTAGNYDIGSLRTSKAVSIQGAGANETILNGCIDYNTTAVQDISISGISMCATKTEYNHGVNFSALKDSKIVISDCSFEGYQFGIGVNSSATGNDLQVSSTSFTSTGCAAGVKQGEANNSVEFKDVKTNGGYAIQSFASEASGYVFDGYYDSYDSYAADLADGILDRPDYDARKDSNVTIVTPSMDLQAAIDKASEDATIQLTTGEYQLDATLSITKRINLVGAGAAQTTIVGPVQYLFSAVQGGEGLTVSGITFQADSNSVQGLQFRGDEPNTGYNVEINVQNCDFDGWTYGITMNSHANGYGLTVSGCDFSESLYAVSYNFDPENEDQQANNTVTFGQGNTFAENGFAVQKFNNKVGTDFSDKTYDTVEAFENDKPVITGSVIHVTNPADLAGKVANAPDGATIIVAPGTYSGNITFGGKSLTIKAQYPAYKNGVMEDESKLSNFTGTFNTSEGTDAAAFDEDQKIVIEGFAFSGDGLKVGNTHYSTVGTLEVRNCTMKFGKNLENEGQSRYQLNYFVKNSSVGKANVIVEDNYISGEPVKDVFPLQLWGVQNATVANNVFELTGAENHQAIGVSKMAADAKVNISGNTISGAGGGIYVTTWLLGGNPNNAEEAFKGTVTVEDNILTCEASETMEPIFIGYETNAANSDTPYGTIGKDARISATGNTNNGSDVAAVIVVGPESATPDVFEVIAKDGSTIVDQTLVGKDDTYTLPAAPYKLDYVFKGWSNGTTTYNVGEKATITKDTVFTAQWEKLFSGDSSSSGSSGSTSTGDYAITVDAGKHGDVTVSPKRADEGDTVTITVDPDNGYVVDDVIVTDKNGDDIRVRDRGDGEYTFTMPDSKVTVEVTFVEAGDELSFVDVAKSDYYYDAVKWAVENGVTTGVTDTIFAPGNPCTRAQTVTFLWRAAGMPQAANRVNPFTDVSVNDYYYEAVLWAVENGITGGTTATTFSPNATCTRAQVVTFLWRYSKEDASILPMFTDVAESDYYYGAVAWAVENGVTTGVTDTTFAPGNPCTRGQIVTFLYRYMGK